MKIFGILLILSFLVISGCGYSNEDNQLIDGSSDRELIAPIAQENTEPAVPETSDAGEFELTILDVLQEEDGEYAQVRIDKVIVYSRNEGSKFTALKEGDEIKTHLQFGSKEADTKIDDLTYGSTLPGLKIGDKIKGAIAGCPDNCNSGKGWTLFFYKKI